MNYISTIQKGGQTTTHLALEFNATSINVLNATHALQTAPLQSPGNAGHAKKQLAVMEATRIL
jgi:hypothetical protein